MLSFIRSHPYITVFVIMFCIIFFVAVFGLGFAWGESLLAAAVISAVGVAVQWWQTNGLG
ncbi:MULTISPECIES: hypothetical protein [Chloroflexus]|uniref:hypothetical protein n=1 Tax=Chloroflexus TaxID=1107 RepID=UPI0002E4A7B3|nr:MULTISPECIES: hypothetical protein [Chloroflexus]